MGQIHRVPLFRTFGVLGLTIPVGSDWHLLLDAISGARLGDEIKRQIDPMADICIIAGDIFHAPNGEDTSVEINDMFSRLEMQKNIIYLAGNHDLRGREDPWHSFNLPPNVVMPVGSSPEIVEIKGVKILAGNIFYDFQLVDLGVLGMDKKGLLKQYHEIDDKGRLIFPDGKHLLDGNISSFPEMATNLARKLTPDIDVLVTHCLPSATLATIRVEELTAETLRIEKKTGVKVVCEPEEDWKMAEKRGITPQEFRRRWNTATLIIGSKIITHKQANPKDGLVCIYGHNHRSGDISKKIKGKNIRFISYQDPVA